MHNKSDQRAALNVAVTTNTTVDPNNNAITYSLADMAPAQGAPCYSCCVTEVSFRGIAEFV
jgi:hypothetical protein